MGVIFRYHSGNLGNAWLTDIKDQIQFCYLQVYSLVPQVGEKPRERERHRQRQNSA